MIYTLICRSLIVFLTVFLLIRFMGKRQIGEMQPFEFVVTLVIADLATIPMSDTALPLLHGIIPLFTLVCLHYLLCLLSRKSTRWRKLINGKPIIVIGTNGVDYEALRRLNMSFNDLIEGLRTAGYFNLEEVLYGIIQTNGTLTAVPRAPYAPLTASDMNIEKEQATLPMIVFAEGKINKENINIAGIDSSWLALQVKKAGLNGLNEIILITLSNTGKLYIQPKNKPFVLYQSNYKGGSWWKGQ